MLDVLRRPPLARGTQPDPISLTADDGAWVRSDDHLDRHVVVLVFASDLADPATQQGLRDLEAARAELESLDGFVAAVNHQRPDALRQHRQALGLNYPLLYDLLALGSRAVRQSGRRPYVLDGTLILDKQGRVASHVRGPFDAAATVRTLRELAGKPQVDDALKEGGEVDWTRAEALILQGYAIVDVRTRDEFDAIHHPRAINLPVDELPARIAEIGRSSRILTVCQTGGRSTAAAGFLVGTGAREVYTIRAGMAGWPGVTAKG